MMEYVRIGTENPYYCEQPLNADGQVVPYSEAWESDPNNHVCEEVAVVAVKDWMNQPIYHRLWCAKHDPTRLPEGLVLWLDDDGKGDWWDGVLLQDETTERKGGE